MEHISDILWQSDWQKLMEQSQLDRNTANNWLKEDAALRETLKEIILAFADELKQLKERRTEFLNSDKYSGLGDFAPYFRQRVFDEVLEGQRIPLLKHRLKNMVYALKRAQGAFRKNKEWQRQYDHATRDVRIGDVIRHFVNNGQPFSRLLKCPFHEDKTASFKVYEQSNRFHCFGCGLSGSPVDFVMKISNCDFKEAVVNLSLF